MPTLLNEGWDWGILLQKGLRWSRTLVQSRLGKERATAPNITSPPNAEGQTASTLAWSHPAVNAADVPARWNFGSREFWTDDSLNLPGAGPIQNSWASEVMSKTAKRLSDAPDTRNMRVVDFAARFHSPIMGTLCRTRANTDSIPLPWTSALGLSATPHQTGTVKGPTHPPSGGPAETC